MFTLDQVHSEKTTSTATAENVDSILTEEPISLPANFVPTPTIEYRQSRKLDRLMRQSTVRGANNRVRVDGRADAGPILIPIPIPHPPLLHGTRVLIWKQDPSVGEIGVRKAALPAPALAGPRDARIVSVGLPSVSPNVFGDFIQTPGTTAFDAVHTFAVVRMTLTMFQRALGGAPMRWQWNSASNTDPLSVFAHGLPNVVNAFYSRQEKALKFGDFIRSGTNPPQRIFTCRSFDIVSHECGHAILDALKPGWLGIGNPPQTGGLHESFGDLTAIFLALSQFDQVEAVIAQTRANLHDKTFLSDLAEEFGLALGRPNGLRNADNDLKLSQVGNEVHDLSQVFTGAIYDILADIFAFERNIALKDDAAVLWQCAQYLHSLVVRAIVAAPLNGARYADVANQMLNIAAADGKPVQYRNFIRNRFAVREIVLNSTPFAEDHRDGDELVAVDTPYDQAPQDRSACCGTMRSPEFTDLESAVQMEAQELRRFYGDKNAQYSQPASVISLDSTGNGKTSADNGGKSRARRSKR